VIIPAPTRFLLKLDQLVWVAFASLSFSASFSFFFSRFFFFFSRSASRCSLLLPSSGRESCAVLFRFCPDDAPPTALKEDTGAVELLPYSSNVTPHMAPSTEVMTAL
jgi:hypothetical protein